MTLLVYRLNPSQPAAEGLEPHLRCLPRPFTAPHRHIRIRQRRPRECERNGQGHAADRIRWVPPGAMSSEGVRCSRLVPEADRELLLRLLLFRPCRHPQTSFPPPSLPRPRPPVPPPLVPPLLLRRRHRRARVLQWRPPLTALADARPSMEAANERIKKIAALKDECVLKRTELAAKYQAWRGVWPGKDSKDICGWEGRDRKEAHR